MYYITNNVSILIILWLFCLFIVFIIIIILYTVPTILYDMCFIFIIAFLTWQAYMGDKKNWYIFLDIMKLTGSKKRFWILWREKKTLWPNVELFTDLCLKNIFLNTDLSVDTGCCTAQSISSNCNGGNMLH